MGQREGALHLLGVLLPMTHGLVCFTFHRGFSSRFFFYSYCGFGKYCGYCGILWCGDIQYLEVLVGGGVPLFFHRRTTQRALVETGEAVEELLGQKKEGGKLWFLVGSVGEGDSRWVDVDYFLQKVDGGWRKYCERKGLKVDVATDVEEALE